MRNGDTLMAVRRSKSYAADKDDLLRRLRKVEGQVRGLQAMVEAERYCLDIVQQINALTAAAREVALLILSDHLKGCVVAAATGDDQEAAIKEMMTVLGKALRQ
jgi:CsoR family transcriptional regulator, copper-sensing transcriptional repressor